MMSTHSILVGKAYRTPAGEIRQVKSVDGGNVAFTVTTAPHGVGLIGKSSPQQLTLSRFAEEVEEEVKVEGP